TRGYRHYRDPGQLAFARVEPGEGNLSEDALQQQSSPDWNRVVDVRRRLSADTSLQRHAVRLGSKQKPGRRLQLLGPLDTGLLDQGAQLQSVWTAKTYPGIAELALGLVWPLPVHYQGTGKAGINVVHADGHVIFVGGKKFTTGPGYLDPEDRWWHDGIEPDAPQ